jgi:hypothetical protein
MTILNKFEKIVKENFKETLVPNILNLERTIDDDSKTLTISPKKGFQPLKLFYDPYSEEYNFPTLFYGNPRPSFTCSYQKIVEFELTNVNRIFHII